MKNKYILGLDTSNYKTSIAVTDQRQSIVCDLREFLKVKQGDRGLRQSDALFQHINNIPRLMEKIMNCGSYEFEAIAFSSKPRPVDGSYMPVFLAGEGYGRAMAAALGIPALDFSHQEGHIEGVKSFSAHRSKDEFLSCHFSGGTSELLHVKSTQKGYHIDIIGGSKDIAFGQVIDRAGVDMGLAFPSGEELDALAEKTEISSELLSPVKVNEAWLNLSGTDTQMKRALAENSPEIQGSLVRELFDRLADAMALMVIQGAEKTGITDVLMAGGVTSSRFIRKRICELLVRHGINAEFDNKGLAQDNAVGIALLGGRYIWH